MRFNLIGPFEIVTDDGRVHRPGTPKVCQTLALLLTRPNEIITAESLIQELWGERPPRSAVTTLQTYVYHARRMFVNERLTDPDRHLIVTCPPGYAIQVDEDEVDVQVFERLVNRARLLLADGDPTMALLAVGQALELWRGPALANFPAGDVLTGHLAHLEELRIRAYEIRIEAKDRLGQHRESIAELRRLINDYPLNEWFHSRLIAALGATGRRAEALQAYQNVRRLLADELGLEPSVELKRIQLRLLNPEPGEVAVRAPHRTLVARSA
ncbi:BTAD domain-containing putative transcriptional regulator [Streptomyces sp. 43Y-GA-1]|uniref:AfsR/SARP family transcriptional regulator n=1 Tax=Streptomyces sp. 43Y-GA-1 TaxID=2939435 RepID=UPI0020BF9AC3|nr:BTAD domain-containing putative transcriptional regulator [Streptomyces sp. 43Y-GA-1]MCL6291359.1 AfsR/SARP family transcriptional regulator [Streptomyces sp. 43Y-GA-1]